MARRAGKAASRKARQRNVPRQPRPVAPPPPTDESVTAEPAATVVSAPSPAAAGGSRRFATVGATSAGSTLTARERSEYHYVERDLRNIGILTAIMVGLLLAAWALFSATGLIA